MFKTLVKQTLWRNIKETTPCQTDIKAVAEELNGFSGFYTHKNIRNSKPVMVDTDIAQIRK